MSKNETLLKQLLDANPGKVLEALEQVKTSGNSAIIEPLLELLKSSGSSEVIVSTRKLLSEIKDEKCTPILISALGSERHTAIHDAIAGALWQSGLKCEPYITEIVDAAIAGNYSVAVECMSIIESMEGELPESAVVEAIRKLKTQLNNRDDKNLLLVEIIEILQNRLME